MPNGRRQTWPRCPKSPPSALNGHGKRGCARCPHAASKSPSRCAARSRLRPDCSPSGIDTDEAGRRALRVRRPVATRLFPDDVHHFAAVRDGGWRVGRNRHRRQRGHPRHLAVHGRRHHAQPRDGAERRACLPPQGGPAQDGIRAVRPDHAPAAALHAGADHADGADRGLQPASLGRPATVPLAAAEPRSPAIERADDDAGTDRQHARRAPRRRHRRRRQAAGGGTDQLSPRHDHRARSARASRRRPASATRSSRRNSTACCPTSRISGPSRLPRATDPAACVRLCAVPRRRPDAHRRTLARNEESIGGSHRNVRPW